MTTIDPSKTFGQLVIGPPGAGKSTFCKRMSDCLEKLGRKVAVVNMDPFNDDVFPYDVKVNITQLITVEDTMLHKKLGPNGALLYCMEYLEKNFKWFLKELQKFKDHYFIFDCSGQVELYSYHNSVKAVMKRLERADFKLCVVNLIDGHFCNHPSKFISCLLLTLSTMLHMELPVINVLTKMDLMTKYSGKLPLRMEYYTEVLDLKYILQYLETEKFGTKYKKLNAAIAGLIEDFSLVVFHPQNTQDPKSLMKIQREIDKANGFYFNNFAPERCPYRM